MKFFGIKQDGKIVHLPAIAEAKRKFWERIPDGAEIESVITVKRGDKSQAQLATIFGLALAMLAQEFSDNGWDSSFLLNLDRPTGIPCDVNLLKEFFYNVCPTFDENGKRITLSRMD